MGMVFEAEDTRLRRRVALKVMLPDIASEDQARIRFLREARAAAALKHDHIVTVYDVGEDRGTPFLAMELLQGASLAAWLETKTVATVPELLTIGRQTARGLMAAHAAGLIHRDIKPANIWLEAPKGRIKILDFGLARWIDVRVDDEMSKLTKARDIVGTPGYMAPEQVRGDEVTAKADLFSFGCVLYRAATGHPAFSGESLFAILSAVVSKQPMPVRDLNPNVPRELASLIETLLCKDADLRPSTAKRVLETLQSFKYDLPTTVERELAKCTPRSVSAQMKTPAALVLWWRNRGIASLVLVAVVAFSLVCALLISKRFKPQLDVTRNATRSPPSTSSPGILKSDHTATRDTDQRSKVFAPASPSSSEVASGSDKAPAIADDAHQPSAPGAQPPNAKVDEPIVPGREAPVSDAPAVEVGRFISDDQILARQSSEDGSWHRLPERQIIHSGERLLAFDGFRPQIALANGALVSVMGATSFHIRPPNDGAACIFLEFGTIRLVSLGDPGVKIELDLAGIRNVVTLIDSDSSIGVSVNRRVPAGRSPETTAGVPVVEYFGIQGGASIEDSRGGSIGQVTNEVRIYRPSEPVQVIGSLSKWSDVEDVSAIERAAARQLHDLIDNDRPLDVALAESCQDRRAEVSALAANGMAVLGQFEPLIGTLSGERQKSFWGKHVRLLRALIQRSPEAAVSVKDVIARLHPDDGPHLWRLLWGYSATQLEEDRGAELVSYLEHDNIAVRVAAFENLLEITGVQLLYRPEKPAREQRAPLSNWKKRVQEGSITYKVAPIP